MHESASAILSLEHKNIGYVIFLALNLTVDILLRSSVASVIILCQEHITDTDSNE